MKTITNFYITLAFAANLIPALPLYAMSHTPEHNQQNQYNQEDEETKESAQDTNQINGQPLSPEQQIEVNNALLKATKSGDTDAAHTALTARADVNTRGICKLTPLMQAAQRGNISLVTLLLAHKANVHLICQDFMNPLCYAIHEGDFPEIVNILLEHNAPIGSYTMPNEMQSTPPLTVASRENHILTVKALLCAGADTSLVELDEDDILYYNKTAFECARSDEMRAAFAEVPQTKKEAKEAVGTLQELLIQQILENNFLPVTSIAGLTLDYAVPYINAVEYYFLNKSVAAIWNTIKKATQVARKKAAQAGQAASSTLYLEAAAMPAPQLLLMAPLTDTEEDEKEQASEQVISATNTVPTPPMPEESFRASAYRDALQRRAQATRQAPPTPNENGFYDSDPE